MKTLDELITATRDIKMTPDQLTEQRRSFVYGNCSIENCLITREMVDEADEENRNRHAAKPMGL